MSKLNIFKKEWLDIVFENRNKSYGAYQLRLENPRTTIMSFFIGIGLFGGVIGLTTLFGNVQTASGSEVTAPDYSKTLVVDRVPIQKKEDKKEEIKEVAEDMGKAKVVVLNTGTVMHTNPKVVADKDVKNEMLNMEDILKSNPGLAATEPSIDGVIDVGVGKIGEEPNEGVENGVLTEDNGNAIIMNVQVKAAPIGGMHAFSNMFVSRFRSPEMANSVSEIKVIVSFVVEKDGSLTDIKVLRDPGYGVGVEAIRVLKGMPKWDPARQNGTKVRSQFTLPITIKVN